ncbi:MAG: ABC transporter permease [Chloroflexi bacterium]|nr:ABC transporter permease [Chloroflexota bacterium]
MFALLRRDLLHHRGEALLAALGMAVVIFSYLILSALAQTLQDAAQLSTPSRNLIVLPNDVFDPSAANVSPQAVQAVAALQPNPLERVSPLIFRHTRIDHKLAYLRAAPLEDWETVHHLALLAGEWPGPAGEAAIGEGAARAHGWQISDVLRIFGQDFRVTAVFRSPGGVYASVWLPLEAAQELFAPRRASQMLILQPAPQANLEALRQQIQSLPALSGGYAVFFEEAYNRQHLVMGKDFASLLRVVSGIALLSILFGIYNSVQLSASERMREIVILRAVGFRPAVIRSALALRALLLGGLAYALGLAAAWAFTAYLAAYRPLFILGWSLVFALDWRSTLTALAWTLLLTPAGAWLATLGVFQQGVAAALREAA